MNAIRRWATVGVMCGMAMSAATAGALDECVVRGDQAAVSRCLLDADREAQSSLNAAEGAAGTRARELDTVTGRPRANAALARSLRAFAEYRKMHCEYIKAMYASGNGADQGALACRIDLTRRRVRDLQP